MRGGPSNDALSIRPDRGAAIRRLDCFTSYYLFLENDTVTKIEMRRIILAELNRLSDDAQRRIDDMTPERENPQIAAMLLKNAGYKMAMGDMIEFMRNIRATK